MHLHSVFVSVAIENVIDTNNFRVDEDTQRIFGHTIDRMDITVFFEGLYTENSGNTINMPAKVRLTEEGLLALEIAINIDDLAITFDGRPIPDTDTKQADLQLVTEAQAELQKGRAVYYYSTFAPTKNLQFTDTLSADDWLEKLEESFAQ